MSAFVVLAVAVSPLVGQDFDRPEKPVDGSQATESLPGDPEAPIPAAYRDDETRSRAYQAGVMMIGGIVIAGVGLITLVMIWGNRMRRIARQPLPAVAPRDELWFLKHKKRDATSSASEPPDADEAGK